MSLSISSIGGKIVVNGKHYAGNSVSVVNGRVLIDGKPVDVQPQPGAEPVIRVEVTGGCGPIHLEAGELTVYGNVQGDVKTASGNVRLSAGDIRGSASSMSGDIECNQIHGNVSTMSGDIRH